MECAHIIGSGTDKRIHVYPDIDPSDITSLSLIQLLMSGKKLHHEVYRGEIYNDSGSFPVLVDVFKGPSDRVDDQVSKSLKYQTTLSLALRHSGETFLGYRYLQNDQNEERVILVSSFPKGESFDVFVKETLQRGDFDAFFLGVQNVLISIINMTWGERIKHGRIFDLRCIYYDADSQHVSFINFVSSTDLPVREGNAPVRRNGTGGFTLSEWALSDLPDLMYALNAVLLDYGGEESRKVMNSIRDGKMFEYEGWNMIVDYAIRTSGIDIIGVASTAVNVMRGSMVPEIQIVSKPQTQPPPAQPKTQNPKEKSPQKKQSKPKGDKSPKGKSPATRSVQEEPPKIVPVEIIKDIDTILEKTWQKAASIKKPAKDYQKVAVKHMMYNNGLIVGFEVGTGKTLTATMTIFALERLYKMEGRGDLKVIILTPASLKENMQDQMIQFGMEVSKTKPRRPTGSPPPKLFETTRYEFMTFAKFQREYKKGAVNCKDVLLVVDEAHNMRKDYRNTLNPDLNMNIKVDNTVAEFGLLCSAKAWKSVLLTATPVYNKPYDIVNLVDMAKHRYPPMDLEEWTYVQDNEEALNNTFQCLVTFQASNKADFPLRIDKYVNIEMTDEYYKKYHNVELSIWATMRRKEKRANPNQGEDGEGQVSNAFNVALKKATNDLEPYLKIDYIKTVLALGEKTVIFSVLVDSGVNTIKRYMDSRKELRDKYVEISGEVKIKERTAMVNRFNSGKAFVFLITKAGGEGLDLKGVRHVIILEQGWNDATNEQAIGRGIRYKSHADLPPEERNTTVHYLVITKPKEVRERLKALYKVKPRRGNFEESPYSADEYFKSLTESKRIENRKLMTKVEANDIKNGCTRTPN